MKLAFPNGTTGFEKEEAAAAKYLKLNIHVQTKIFDNNKISDS